MEKKVKVFYEAMNWELPLDKKNTLERFFQLTYMAKVLYIIQMVKTNNKIR